MHEQKKISKIKLNHIHEIHTEALLLLNKIPFQKINMSLLASKLEFSRANLYKYYETIEAVYMDISIDLLFKFKEKVEAIKVIDVTHFIKSFSRCVVLENDLWKLFGLMDNILEKNVSFDSFVSYKRQFYVFYEQLLNIFRIHFSDLNEVDILKIYHFFYLMTPPMYNALHISETKKQVLKVINQAPIDVPMIDMYETYFYTFIMGIYKK